MKLIHHGPYTVQERESYKEIVFSNTVQSMKVLVDAMEVLGLSVVSDEAAHAAQLILGVPDQIETPALPSGVAEAIAVLWRDTGVQSTFARAREFQLNDSAPYYFDAIGRIGMEGYVPTDQDVLRTRVKTTGILEETFEVDHVVYRIFDVGGQRSERRKWIHCFEAVTALLFLVALSEYDQALYEEARVNRMQEALILFDSICNSRWFSRTSCILFLNKIDLFRIKLPLSPLQDYFEDYFPIADAAHNPDEEYTHACKFLAQKFTGLNRNPAKTIYVHYTCATDTSQIRFVLQAVRDIITRINLQQVGLL